MKVIRWDDPDPRVVWGNVNLRWSDPSYLLEEGDLGYVELQPGQPGYVPPQPARPRRRAASSLTSIPEPPNTTTAMSFQIVILPNPQNELRPFRGRPKMGEQVGESEFLDAVVVHAADPAVTRAVVEKVIESLFAVMIGYLRQTRPLAYILGLFRATTTITGSFPTNAPGDDALNAGIGANFNLGPLADAALTDGITTEIVGEEGTITPEIDSIVLSPGGQADKYSLTAAFKVSGDHFRGSG